MDYNKCFNYRDNYLVHFFQIWVDISCCKIVWYVFLRHTKFAGFSTISNAFFLRRGSTWVFQIGFPACKVGLRQVLWVVFCQLFSVSQSFIQLICFFVFFRANLLSAGNFTGLGWLAWLLSGDSKSERSRSYSSPTQARA